ncbi:MAG: CDP-alcohol phosphatidyltransferase family protein, partial [Phycisphaeraceae bacterium]
MSRRIFTIDTNHYHETMREAASTTIRGLRFLPPALLTAGNAAAGIAATLLLTSCLADADRFVGQWIDEVFVLLAIAMICDVLDGPASRALGVASELGKKGDAAADAISFGGVPALLIAVVAWESNAARWIGLLC